MGNMNNYTNNYTGNNRTNHTNRTTANHANKSWSPKQENKAKYDSQNPNYQSKTSKYNLNNYQSKNQNKGNNKGYNSNKTPNNKSSNNPRFKTSKNSSDTFFKAMENTINSCYKFSITENGAIGHATTGSALLDMNFKLTSYRNMREEDITSDFIKAFNENPVYTMKELFYFRDVREGQGERNLFRVCMKSLANNGQTILVNELIPLMAEYGRWDDVLVLLDTPCKSTVLNLIKNQWNKDMDGMMKNQPISLMSKWLSSEQASSQQAKKNAHIILKALKLSPRNYRKGLSALREYINVVERQMSSQNWQSIDYETVPSKANLLYSKAFLRHDEERRNAYLNGLKNGEAKINSSVTYPHEIVHKYMSEHGGYNYSTGHYEIQQDDETLEAMWRALPNLVPENNNTIVVADGSGSMTSRIAGTNVSALSVANALAIYFAERSTGGFHNQYITFSHNPVLVDLNGSTLRENYNIAMEHNEIDDTNIEAVYHLILNTAKRYHMNQSELPSNILILSDMEFNDCVSADGIPSFYRRIQTSNTQYKTLFDNIKAEYEKAGYKMPKTIFWNLMSRTNTIPMNENELGCILVSGFSVNTLKMVMSNKTDPYEALIEVLDSERYDAVSEAATKAFETQTRLITKAEKMKNSTSTSTYRGKNYSNNGNQVRKNINQYKSKDNKSPNKNYNKSYNKNNNKSNNWNKSNPRYSHA